MKLLSFAVFFALFFLTLQNIFNHTLWTNVLQRHVVPDRIIEGIKLNVVNYAGIRRDKEFNEYVNVLEQWDWESLSFNDKQAFLINVYNAWAIKVIADKPCILRFGKFCWPIKSIWDLGNWFQKIWDKEVIRLKGKQYSLDDIEKRILLNMTDDKPLIHASVVCASVSCPNLRTEAFLGDKLYDQMNDQMSKWMKDETKGYRLIKESNEIQLSKIYFWYKSDFERHVNGTLVDYITKWIPKEDADYINRNIHLIQYKFMDYNWRINDLRSVLKY